MLDAPIPADEALRVADLYALEVLDTEPEWRFDRITQAAQRLFNVPIALVSLIESDRQWFKAHAGLTETELPRNISFCGHTINSDQPFIVPNAAEDERFADNPLVRDLHVRFYAGIPLKSRQGYCLGALCLIDRKPRQLSADELTLLVDLGAWAERELNLREIKEASEAAEQCARQLRHVLESTTDAIISVDEQLIIRIFNRSAEQMFGLHAREMQGQSVMRVLPETVMSYMRESISDLIISHQLHMALQPNLKLLSTDGTSFYADIRLSRSDSQQSQCFTFTIRDVTAQHELDAMKSEFIANVSHELRTPITSIKGAIKLLISMAATLPAQQLRLLDIADKNCSRLSQMVDDILDLERTDSGNLQLNRRVQSLMPSMHCALASMQTYAGSLGVPIVLHANVAESDTVCCIDEVRITQVLVNLLSNAIKFSREGTSVEIHVKRTDQWIRVSVTDYGNGIPEAFRKRIFQRFSQAFSQSVRGHSSSGLGLAICKALIEQHDGRIGFDSQLDVSTTFFFDLHPVSLLACSDEQTSCVA